MKPRSSRRNPVESELERALAPYRELLPSGALAELRAALEEALREHPIGSRLLREAGWAPAVERSGTVARADVLSRAARAGDAAASEQEAAAPRDCAGDRGRGGSR